MNNGETKLFERAKDVRLCPVLAALRIVLRFERLGDDDGVLGISRSEYLTTDVVTRILCVAAAEVLGDTATPEDISVYTLHSIRICVCVLLHEQGHSGVFIKDRLRWRSDTYLDYLRDTPRPARQHAASLAHNILCPDVSVKAICAALTPTSS